MILLEIIVSSSNRVQQIVEKYVQYLSKLDFNQNTTEINMYEKVFFFFLKIRNSRMIIFRILTHVSFRKKEVFYGSSSIDSLDRSVLLR